MTGRRTGIPRLDRPGIVPQRGEIPRRSIFAPGSKRGAERPLVSQFIGEQTLRFYCRAITLAAPVSISGAAWFGIASWAIPDDIGAEAALVGYRVEMSSPPITGDSELFAAGYVSLIPWGETAGHGSGGAVVVGLNLPCRLNVMTNGPANIPFTAQLAGAGTLIGQESNAPKVFHFPTGDLGATSVVQLRTAQVTPLARLLTGGNRLDVAVVISKEWANTVTGTFGMKVYGELSIATTLTQETFID